MHRKLSTLTGAGLLLGVSALAAQAQMVEPTTPPDPPAFPAQSEPVFVGISDILEYRALPEYHEPEWVTEKFVKTGKLPPVGERLPKEPMVYKAANMPDGIGDYGGTLRHVIGGRPEGWNYIAGQSQGWGGIDIGMMECLTRTGPLFTIRAEELQPMPNLAKSWEWSEDGHQLTMHLIEGARWSDGDPFDAEDVMFYWEDHVQDPNVTPLNGASPANFGEGTTLEKIDDYTIRWTFKTPFPTEYLYQMAYGNFCPGPSHILKPQHPKYSDNTYEEYKNAFPPDFLNWPVMGRGCRWNTGRTTSSCCAGTPTTGRWTRRETSSPISTRCTTGCLPGLIATCRPLPVPATSRIWSSLKAMSRHCAAVPRKQRLPGCSSGRGRSVTRCR